MKYMCNAKTANMGTKYQTVHFINAQNRIRVVKNIQKIGIVLMESASDLKAVIEWTGSNFWKTFLMDSKGSEYSFYL